MSDDQKTNKSEEDTTRYMKPHAAMPMYERYVAHHIPTHISLVVLSSNQTVRKQLSQEITIGRTIGTPSPPTHIDLTPHLTKNAGISRIHARISVYEGTVAIEDLGSTNGTFLNGFHVEQFTKVPIKNGDLVEMGKFRVKINFIHEDEGNQ